MLPPAYPYLVAMCMKLFGGFTVATTMAVLTLNSLFAALTVIPVYFLAKRVLDERTALVAGWAWAFFPYSIYLAGGRIYSDTLTCLIATSAVATDAAAGAEPRAARLAALGRAVGRGGAGEPGAARAAALPGDMARGAAIADRSRRGFGPECWLRASCWRW